ncbi:hypothetical protein KM043_002713 [Ampulex compressa]|nr:hypothetical protein KM043_002713 [Ampulex compressa]
MNVLPTDVVRSNVDRVERSPLGQSESDCGPEGDPAEINPFRGERKNIACRCRFFLTPGYGRNRDRSGVERETSLLRLTEEDPSKSGSAS